VQSYSEWHIQLWHLDRPAYIALPRQSLLSEQRTTALYTLQMCCCWRWVQCYQL